VTFLSILSNTVKEFGINAPKLILTFFSFQVMETKSMIYLVMEYASHGEVFGEIPFLILLIYYYIFSLDKHVIT